MSLLLKQILAVLLIVMKIGYGLVLAVLLNFILKLTDASMKILYNQKNFLKNYIKKNVV